MLSSNAPCLFPLSRCTSVPVTKYSIFSPRYSFFKVRIMFYALSVYHRILLTVKQANQPKTTTKINKYSGHLANQDKSHFLNILYAKKNSWLFKNKDQFVLGKVSCARYSTWHCRINTLAEKTSNLKALRKCECFKASIGDTTTAVCLFVVSVEKFLWEFLGISLHKLQQLPGVAMSALDS